MLLSVNKKVAIGREVCKRISLLRMDKNFQKPHTDVLDCYDTPKMLILVFIEFRENKEW